MDDQPIYEMKERLDGRFDFGNTDRLFGRMRERSVARPEIEGWNAEFLH